MRVVKRWKWLLGKDLVDQEVAGSQLAGRTWLLVFPSNWLLPRWASMWWLLGLLVGWPLPMLRAQPGGGGGLEIGGLYGRDAQGKLRPLAPAAVQVRVFLLGESSTTWAGHVIRRPGRSRDRPVLTSTQTLRAKAELPAWQWHQDNTFLTLRSEAPQRVYLRYQADTMVLDLANMRPPNGAGYRSLLDSLVFMPGYFSLSVGPPFEESPAPDTYAPPGRLRRERLSLTPSLVAALQASHLLVVSQRTDTPLLWALPDSTLLRTLAQAAAFLPRQPQQVLTTLTRAEAAGVSLLTPEACLLRVRAYRQLHQPLLAEQWLTQAIGLAPARPLALQLGLGFHSVRYWAYQLRQSLRLQERHYGPALADYDSLQAIERASDRAQGRLDATSRKEARIARLLFQLDSLHDPQAHLALRAYLEPDLTAAWRCRSEVIDADVLDRLAKAEYARGEQALAYQHWQVLLLQGNLDAEPYLHAFTGLLQQHPGQPDLLLCRALAHVVHSADYYGQPARPLLAAALRDLQAAARLRPHDFRVPYFRAKVYETAGQLPQAVAELGRAIAENATLPALYRYRHELRALLHQVAEFSRDDPDYARYSDLCNNGY